MDQPQDSLPVTLPVTSGPAPSPANPAVVRVAKREGRITGRVPLPWVETIYRTFEQEPEAVLWIAGKYDWSNDGPFGPLRDLIWHAMPEWKVALSTRTENEVLGLEVSLKPRNGDVVDGYGR